MGDWEEREGDFFSPSPPPVFACHAGFISAIALSFLDKKFLYSKLRYIVFLLPGVSMNTNHKNSIQAKPGNVSTPGCSFRTGYPVVHGPLLVNYVLFCEVLFVMSILCFFEGNQCTTWSAQDWKQTLARQRSEWSTDCEFLALLLLKFAIRPLPG